MKLREREIRLNIGGMGISLKWKGVRLRHWPHPFYRDFISTNGKTDINLRLYKGKPPFFSKKDIVFDGESNLWKLYRDNSRYIIEVFNPAPPHQRTKVAFIEGDFSSGDVYIPDNNGQKTWSPGEIIKPLVEILLVNRLSLNQGILVHGLAVREQGKANLFIGRSGAGKTTLARLYIMKGRENNILNDERLIIRKIKGRFFVFSTPWAGEASIASSQALPIDKIFFIQHAKKNIISPLEANTFFSNLFPQLFLPFWDKERLDYTIKLCEEIVLSIPSYTLGFIKDKSVVDFIRKFYRPSRNSLF